MASSLRILITDEDPDSRVNARKAVQRAGLAVAGETGFGTEAVSAALESKPDAILIAVEEPVGRPLDTAEALATALPDTPIIIYSSDNEATAVRRGMIFGARDYLPKPLSAVSLVDAITRSLEQEERRQLRRAGQLTGLSGRGTVITVTGAKGGVGKTVLTVNLAIALKKETGKSVAVLDADAQFGDVATMVDLKPAVTAADLLRRVETLDRTNIRQFVTAHASGVDIVCGPPDDDVWSICTREQLHRVVDALAQTYEFVVIDTSGSFDRFVHDCIDASTYCLVVTSGEVSSLRDTGTAVRRLDSWGVDADRVAIILARRSQGTSPSDKDMEAAIGRPFFAKIPFDKAVPQSVQVGQPVILTRPRSAMATGATLIARRLVGTRKSLVRPAPAEGRWKWIHQITSKEKGYDADVAAVPEASNSQH